ncbi:hypothetical protein ACFL6S_25030 [Candidatus Poribacteria bacterium]
MEFRGDSPNISLEAVKANAVFSDVYRFFDITIAMKSDREYMLAWFRRLYPRFRQENANEKADATYYMMYGTLGEAFVVAEENSHLETRSAGNQHSAIFYASLLVSNYIAGNMKSHFLLHGAAISYNGNGMAIAGPSYYGKTSLTLQLLLRKGFRFLSDDQLAINRATHLVDPFPRGIGIRENTLAFFDELELEHLESSMDSGGQRKWLVDISEISENGLGKTCRLRYLVFLVNSLDETEKSEQHIELTLDEINDKLLEKFRSIARNGEIRCRYMGSFYAVSFQPEAEALDVLEIEHVCESYGVWLLGVRKFSNDEPDFSLTPRIQPISWHEAVMELLKGLQNDFRGAPLPTFLELAGILEEVECYKLSVGKLDEMGEHISNLVLNSDRPCVNF